MLEALHQRLGYHLKDPFLLQQALTHRGAHRELNNQRMEFLGDRVLALVVVEMLYHHFPQEREGELARRFAVLSNKETLIRLARSLGLGALLRLSAQEEAGQGRTNGSNLADAFEALLGAIFLDGGFETARVVVRHLWLPLLSEALTPPKDAKTHLQEWLQGRGHPLPFYEELERKGPSHAPEFVVRVMGAGEEATTTGTVKRVTEQRAAEALLAILQKKEPS